MDGGSRLRENGKIKARVEIDDFDTSLLTMRNGFQWTGQPVSPELATLIIEVLNEYLESL